MKKKHHWIDIAEYATLVGLGLGSVASFMSSQYFYSSAPLSLLILLNLANRNRLEQVIQEDTQSSLDSIDRKVSQNLETLQQQIHALPTPEAMGSLRKSMLVKNRELAERLAGEIKTLQDGVQAVLDMVERLKLGTVRQDLDGVRQQYESLNAGVATLTGQFQALTSSGRFDKLEQAIAQLKTETQQLQSNLQTLSDQTRPTLISLQDQISHLNRQVQKLPPPFDSSALKQEVTELMRMVADLVPKRDWSALVTELQTLQKLQETHSEAEETLRRKLQELNLQLQSRPTKSSLTSLQNQINHLNRQVQKLPPPFDPTSLKKEVAKLLKVVSELVPKRDFGSLVAQVRALQEQQEFQQRVEQTLREELETLNEQLQTLMSDPNALVEPPIQSTSEPQQAFQSRLEDMLHQELHQMSEQLQQLPTGPELQAQVEAMLRQELLHVNQQLQAYADGATYEFVLDFKSESGAALPDGTPGVDFVHTGRTVLEAALTETQERLIIILPWSNQLQLDPPLVEQLEAFLQQNHRLDLGWCHQTDPTQMRLLGAIQQRWQLHSPLQNRLQQTLETLLWLKRTYPQVLQFKIMGTHETFLVSDTAYAVLGMDEAVIGATNLPEMELKLRTTDTDTVQRLIQQYDSPDLAAADVAAYWNRAATRLDLGDRQGALEDCHQILTVEPDNAYALNFRGILHYELGDRQTAIADFNQALKLNPQLTSVYCNRGYLRAEAGDQLGAIADYSAALRLDNQSAVVYFLRGMACQKFGEIEGAIADYTASLQLNPDSATPNYYRGVARSKQGDVTGAIADLENALERFTQWGQETNARKVFKYLQKLREVAPASFTMPPPQEAADAEASTSSEVEHSAASAEPSSAVEPTDAPTPAPDSTATQKQSEGTGDADEGLFPSEFLGAPAESPAAENADLFEADRSENAIALPAPESTDDAPEPTVDADSEEPEATVADDPDVEAASEPESAAIALPAPESTDDAPEPTVDADSEEPEATAIALPAPPLSENTDTAEQESSPEAIVLPSAPDEAPTEAPEAAEPETQPEAIALPAINASSDAIAEPSSLTSVGEFADSLGQDSVAAETDTSTDSAPDTLESSDPFAALETEETPEFNPFSMATLENFFDTVEREAAETQESSALSTDEADSPEAAIPMPASAIDELPDEETIEPPAVTETAAIEPEPPTATEDTVDDWFGAIDAPPASHDADAPVEEEPQASDTPDSPPPKRRSRHNGTVDPGTLTLSNLLEDLNEAGELDEAVWPPQDQDEKPSSDPHPQASDPTPQTDDAAITDTDSDGTLSDLCNLF